MNSPATRLRLFGAPVLSDADGSPVGGGTAQPHRIALLALLALHPNRTVPRADLTAHLWPGLDQKEANQLLNKELFSINKAVGDDAIFSNAKEVRLGSRVTVDALDFQAALDDGRPGDAMQLYTGPLLDDFVLEDAPEFQGWAANQRARFAAARKSLRPISEAAPEVQHDIAEPTPEIVREVAPPRPRVARKRPKPPPEVPRAAPEPPPEPPPEVPQAAPEPPPEVSHAAPEPTLDVFWAPESPPAVGHAAQDSAPEMFHTSQEMPSEILRSEPPLTPDFAREASAPPPDVAPESAEPVVWLDPEAAEPPPVADVPPDVAEPVADVAPPEAPPALEATPSDRARSRAVRRRRPIPLPSARLVITVLALALLGGIGYVARGRIADAGARARSFASRIVNAGDRARSIAVLPIEFSGRDPADQVLAAGISEQLRRMLSDAGLRVTPTDVFAYRAPPYDIRGIAETLGVAHVLQGAMRKDGAQVQFRFQLVNAPDGVTRWDQTYAPQLSDIMVLEEDVAITVARQIQEKPATALPQRETKSGAAYPLVLRGNDPALVRSDSAARRGLELFRQAVAIDAGYARAWAGLARMYVRTTATLGAADRGRQLALANQAAQRAVTLDDSLAEAHAALGAARSALFDMAGAETHMQRALELDPTRATHESLVNLYLWTGRHDQALAITERALARDPRSPYAHADVARVLQLMNRCDEALAHLDQVASATRPTRAAETRALCHAQAGRWNEAIAAARSAITPRDSSSVSLLAFLLQRGGNSAEAGRLRQVVNDRLRRGRASAVDLALVDAGAGNFDAAARRVQEAVDARSFVMAPGGELVVVMGPLFQELHRRPGFVEARKRLQS